MTAPLVAIVPAPPLASYQRLPVVIPCACGGSLSTSRHSLAKHQATTRHRAWRERCGL